MVCKLKFLKYSLKQFPYGWNYKIMHFFLKNLKGTLLTILFILRKIQKNFHVIIILDVDDLISAFNDLILLKEKKDNLLKKFEMVNLIFLGVKNKLCSIRLSDLFEPKQVHWKYIEVIWNGYK
jgi:hypothetical protein